MRLRGFSHGLKLDDNGTFSHFFARGIWNRHSRAFVFLFVFGFLWYATLMHDAHREVPTLLRPEARLKSYFGWLALGQFVMAFFFTLLCARYVPSGRAGAGAMLGLLVGSVYAGPHL